jgi:putative alpha-1,2-mannosidase
MQVAFGAAAGVGGRCAQRAQKWLRQSAGLFSAQPAMFPGDEDNGSMGAWYVFNALGLYPLSPSSGNYTLGSPLFARVEIPVSSGATLVISALNQAPANVYVSAATWNGAAIAGVTVAYADLMAGGTLEFTMSATPNAAG